MTGAQQYLRPDQAIPVRLREAVDEGSGPFAEAYEAYYKRTEKNILFNEYTKTGKAAPDPKTLNEKVRKHDQTWIDLAQKTYDESQGLKTEGVNIDPAVAQNFAGNLLSGGSIGGALSGLMMTLKPVQDFIAVAMNVIGSSFGDKPVSWDEAWEQIEIRDKTTAAANALTRAKFISDPNAFASDLHNTPAPATETTPAPNTDAAGASNGTSPAPQIPVSTAKLDNQFNAPNGSTTPPPTGIPVAVRKGVAQSPIA